MAMDDNYVQEANPSNADVRHHAAEAEESQSGVSICRSIHAKNIPLNIRADLFRGTSEDEHDGPQEGDNDNTLEQTSPLLGNATTATESSLPGGLVRVRKNTATQRGKRRYRHSDYASDLPSTDRKGSPWLNACLFWCCRHNSHRVQSTISCFKFLGRLLFWSIITALVMGVFWYSYELHINETEPIKIAWFGAGAFVLLGFPISMWGIFSHLANYNQPHVQVYIVRILWMVPVYSIESWLAMRFHKHAIYIETFRDFYESYVLYSFLQFLIQVLGGEAALILMLKDKSPTRGVHMWGLQYCVKPWIMGQPVSKTIFERTDSSSNVTKTRQAVKRVHWKSPFFVKCKFGVLQYVLLKLLSAIAVLWLEWKGWYKEGHFSWKSGYLYICFLTNVSQCWALYCLIFFYYATKNELSPIRPVGKFLSVKALVFFTWWQSVIIAILYQWGMIPEQLVNAEQNYTEEDVAKGIQDYLICVEMFFAAVVHSFVFPHTEYSPQAVRARNRAFHHRHQQSNSPDAASVDQWQHRRLGRSKFHPHPYARYWSPKDDASKASNVVEMTSLDSNNPDSWEEPALWQSIQPQQEPTVRSVRSASYDGPWDMPVEMLVAAEDSRNEVEAGNPEEEGHFVLAAVSDYEVHDETNEDTCEDYEEEYTSVDETSFREDEDENPGHKTGFIRAFLDSAIPRDLGNSTMGIVKGDYNVEKKTLLNVATTSDQYDLFSPSRMKRKTST